MKRLLVALAVPFCVGIAAGECVPVSFFWLTVLLACLCPALVLVFNRKAYFQISVALFMFGLGILHLKNADTHAPCHLTRMNLRCDEAPCLLKGVIKTHPAKEAGLWRFVFAPEQIQYDGANRTCCAQVVVSGLCDSELSYGDELIINGRMRQATGSYGDYLCRKNIDYTIRANDRRALLKTGLNKAAPFEKAAVFLRRRVLDFISSHTSPVAGGVVKAMILGEKEHVPRIFVDAMTKTGTVHILVVSGFNVGIVAMVILVFMKLLRLPRCVRLAAAMAAVVFYCFVTGSSSPVARATIMAEVYMAALFFKRDPDIYNSLTVAALLILAQNPRQLLEIGFQLSFASVVAMTFLCPRFKGMLGAGAIKIRFFRFIAEGFLVSFSAWIGTATIIAYNFRIFSPATVIANVCIVPLASCITITGFIMAGASFVAPGIACAIAYSLELMVFLLIKINLFIVRIPGAYFYLP